MRSITKGPEPACLVALRTTPGAVWSSVHGEQKAEIVARLYADQRGLCAYCMRRLTEPSTAAVRVEHWAPRHEADADPFAWRDLLGVCDGGGDGAPRAQQHCDRRKGGRSLSIHPARDRGLEQRILFHLDGRVNVNAPELRAQLIDEPGALSVLNLDAPKLVANRRAVVDALLDLRKRRPERLRAALARYREPDADGRLLEYAALGAQVLERWVAVEEKRRQHRGAAKRKRDR